MSAPPVPAPQAVVVPAAPAPQPQPARDPVTDLIALSTRHFETAQRELQEGHLETAKAEFNEALEVLLESPYGARTEPRIREHFDRLVERISAVEVTALAQGDGFAERQAEPASIDELLAISTFDQPVADAGNDGGSGRRSPGHDPRHRYPVEPARSCRSSSCSAVGSRDISKTG